MPNSPTLILLTSPHWQDYELLDSGNGAKLERFGPYTFVRPEAQAIWQPALSPKRWAAASAVFSGAEGQEGGSWRCNQKLDDRWVMRYRDLRFWAQATAFRHLGVFPEQANHWDWLQGLIRTAQRSIRVLNLFGYTGIASLAAAQAGASVTHIDASKKTLTWAHENQALAGLADQPMRWIVDDALKFVQREARRGARYEGLILDPPKFGRGPKGEVWKIEQSLSALLQDCRAILSDQPLFVVLTAYAIRMSSVSLYYALAEMMSKFGGVTEAGEMVLTEGSAGRLLSTAIFARWRG